MAGKDATLRVRITAELKAKLEAIAARRHIDLSDLVRQVLSDYLVEQDELLATMRENTTVMRELLRTIPLTMLAEDRAPYAGPTSEKLLKAEQKLKEARAAAAQFAAENHID
jgi:antitoxin component of RelBE/YafQ-DinJ toxin-antitoxin module